MGDLHPCGRYFALLDSTRLAGPVSTAVAESKGKSGLVSGTLWQTLAQIIPLIINLTLTPFIINGLGFQRYSVFLLINTITILLSQFDGGLGQSALRFFSVHVGQNDGAASTRLLFTVSAIFLGITVLALVLGWPAAPVILDWFHISDALRDEGIFFLRVLIVLFAVMLLRNLYNSLLYAHGKFAITSVAILSGHVVYAIGLILSIQQGWGLWGVAWTYVAQQVVGSVVTVPIALPYIVRDGLRWMDKEEAREFFSYAWRIQITGLILMFSTQKDQMVAGRILSAQASGPYGQGSNFAQQLRTLPLNAMGPLQTQIGNNVGQYGVEGARDATNRVQRFWVRLLTGWTVVGVPAAFYGVHAWLPQAYADIAAPVAAILIAGNFFSSVPVVLILWGLTLGHPELNLRFSLVGLVANLVLSVVLGVSFGIMGVVAGTAFGHVAAAAFIAWDARRTLATDLSSYLAEIPWLPALAAGALTFALEWLAFGHLPHGALGLLCAGLIAAPGAALYAVLVFGVDQLRAVLGRVPVLRRFA